MTGRSASAPVRGPPAAAPMPGEPLPAAQRLPQCLESLCLQLSCCPNAWKVLLELSGFPNAWRASGWSSAGEHLAGVQELLQLRAPQAGQRLPHAWSTAGRTVAARVPPLLHASQRTPLCLE
ncbi:hypothetical protein NDU88_000640 [Pleurodeles waltl]|uniref:Uncharacterized protein n=1 Tax=Pleurodeles waltl TaxID=8319 RepID=A0AAV7LAT1_PLEWA|nr:hypothetical protein NDU88_000640 [Pleurodeles waltl]